MSVSRTVFLFFLVALFGRWASGSLFEYNSAWDPEVPKEMTPRRADIGSYEKLPDFAELEERGKKPKTKTITKTITKSEPPKTTTLSKTVTAVKRIYITKTSTVSSIEEKTITETTTAVSSIVTTTCPPTQTSCSPKEQMTNGGFELGNYMPWMAQPSDSAEVVSPGDKSTYCFATTLTGTNSMTGSQASSLFQINYQAAGSVYDYSFNYKVLTPGKYQIQLTQGTTAAVLQTLTNFKAGSWLTAKGSFLPATSGAWAMYFSFQNNDPNTQHTFYVDNVSVKPRC